MSTRRLEDFGGNALAYLGYLYLKVTKVPVADLISQLEGQVAGLHGVQPRVPSHRSVQSEEDEGQTQRQHDSRVGNPRRSQFIEPKDSPSLHIELWNPTTEYKPAQSSPANREWERRTATFFNNLPVSEEQWCQKRQTAQLYTADDVFRTVDCLVAGSLDPLRNDKCSSAEKSAFLVAAGDQGSVDALSSSAERAAALIATAEHSKHVAQFFSLVFMAECRVALFNGCSETSVYSAIRKFVEASGGKCNGDKTPALLLSTTLWVLQEQQRQFRRGLLHRGFELFFNEGTSLDFYIRCPKEPTSNARFTAKIPICEVPDEIQASLPLWLPFIVGIRNINQYSYTTICTALDVTLWSRDEDFQKWRDTYLSRTLVICHIKVDCPESELSRKLKTRQHHAKKRKRSPEPKNRTLRPNSIHRQESQFRATGAGQHGEPVFSRHDTSLAIRDSSTLEGEAETAPHSSQGQQVTPGVDLPGDVSVRTAPAPHNSPALPVDSEPGGRIGPADRFCHKQDAATSTTGTRSHDAQKHSAPSLDMQGPCAINTLGAHPPTSDVLLAAAGQVDGPDGEEDAGANPEHVRDQRAGPAALGLPLAAVVENATPAALQTYVTVGDEMDQPTSEETPGEAVRTEGIGTATCPQAGWAASDQQGLSDFMQRLSPGQWDSMGYEPGFGDASFLQNLWSDDLNFMNY